MLLSSPEFFCFLAVVFCGYWLVWRTRLAALAVILLADYFFYARWDLIYLALIPSVAAADFFIARGLARSRNATTRKLLVTASILMNVGLIASCKYVPLFTETWNHVTAHPLNAVSWSLPLGLSFYAFQAMTYTIDVYRNDAKAATSLLTYLASVSFFPTTLAGPITRPADLMPQWERRKTLLTSEEGGRALFLIALGLFKKFLIADYLAEHLINRVFDLPNLYSGGEVLIAVYGYTWQLYYDFSGYTDIAIGAALLLGIKLPINFNHPYRAENIADFWRRWHITLSNWLRDYLYFALPGKRSRWRPYLNLVITFTLGGLWHGAAWTFAIWGLLHGVGLAVLRGFQTFRGHAKPSPKFVPRFLRGFVTFHFVVFTWIFFRAANVSTALDILRQIGSGTIAFANVSGPFLMVLGIAVAAHYWPKSWYEKARNGFVAAPAVVQAAALVLLVAAIEYIAATGAAPFIYTKF